MTPETRLYVTFLSEKVNPSSSFSHESLDENFTILSVTEDEVYSVLVLSEEKRTTDAMNILEKIIWQTNYDEELEYCCKIIRALTF